MKYTHISNIIYSNSSSTACSLACIYSNCYNYCFNPCVCTYSNYICCYYDSSACICVCFNYSNCCFIPYTCNCFNSTCSCSIPCDSNCFNYPSCCINIIPSSAALSNSKKSFFFCAIKVYTVLHFVLLLLLCIVS